MNDPFAFLVLILASGVCLTALFLVVEVLFPRAVEQTRAAASDSPGRSLLLGLVNAGFLIVLAVAITSAGVDALNVIALILLAILVAGLAVGLTAMARFLGQRLFPGSGETKRMVAGSGLLILACLMPFVGWFGLFPYVGLRGLGGFVLAMARRRAAASPAPEG
jgi:hypothetical protein